MITVSVKVCRGRRQFISLHAGPRPLRFDNPSVEALREGESSRKVVAVNRSDSVHWEAHDTLHEIVVVVLRKKGRQSSYIREQSDFGARRRRTADGL